MSTHGPLAEPQVRHRPSRSIAGLSLALSALLAGGCPQPKELSEELPKTLDLEMPDGTVIAAAIATGPIVLANSTWACYRTSDNTFIARVQFGANGKITRFFDNAVYHPSHLGDEIFPDQQPHNLRVPSDAEYSAGAYGSSTGNRFAAALVMHVRWLGVFVGRGTATVNGTVAGNRFDGTFSYNSTFTLPDWPNVKTDRYAIYALRE